MRELSTCDFCGDDAAGVYEVIPEEIEAPDATRRLALCQDCRDTLDGVITPLLDRLSGETDAGPSPDEVPEPEPTTISGAEPEPVPETPEPDRPAAQNEDVQSEGPETETEVREEAVEKLTSADESEPEPAPKPAGYRKLMRLLQNRDGAMSRDALHTLATNAYGISDEEFEEIVEAAIENGDLVETAEGLKA